MLLRNHCTLKCSNGIGVCKWLSALVGNRCDQASVCPVEDRRDLRAEFQPETRHSPHCSTGKLRGSKPNSAIDRWLPELGCDVSPTDPVGFTCFQFALRFPWNPNCLDHPCLQPGNPPHHRAVRGVHVFLAGCLDCRCVVSEQVMIL